MPRLNSLYLLQGQASCEIDNMRIGELAQRSACDIETIRFYKRDGLLDAPAREANGYRFYTEAHWVQLNFIYLSLLLFCGRITTSSEICVKYIVNTSNKNKYNQNHKHFFYGHTHYRACRAFFRGITNTAHYHIVFSESR